MPECLQMGGLANNSREVMPVSETRSGGQITMLLLQPRHCRPYCHITHRNKLILSIIHQSIPLYLSILFRVLKEDQRTHYLLPTCRLLKYCCALQQEWGGSEVSERLNMLQVSFTGAVELYWDRSHSQKVHGGAVSEEPDQCNSCTSGS